MRLSVKDPDLCVGCQCCMFACSRRRGDAGLGEVSIGVHSAGGMDKGFRVVVCRACEDPSCARVCPVDALKPRRSGGVLLDKTKCIGCEHCRDACPLGAVFWDDEQNKPVICVQCGYCAGYCPHGVLASEGSPA